jgi:hypothetical protein
MTFSELPIGAWFGWPGIDDVPMQKVSESQYYSSNCYQILPLGSGGDGWPWDTVVLLDMNFVTISFGTEKTCPRCGGSGYSQNYNQCRRCHGIGKVSS